jgi:hypothetical protein
MPNKEARVVDLKARSTEDRSGDFVLAQQQYATVPQRRFLPLQFCKPGIDFAPMPICEGPARLRIAELDPFDRHD